MGPWRTYRQRWSRVAVRGVYPVCVAAAGLFIFGYVRYGNPALPLALVLAVLFMAIIVWGERLGVKQGLYESEAGVRCVTFFGAYLLLWEDIVGFDHRRAGTWDRVYAKLADGRSRVLPVVLQGQRVVWDGGETRDIVAVLNGRLAALAGVN